MTGRRHLKQQLLATQALRAVLALQTGAAMLPKVDDEMAAIKGGFADSLPPNNRKTRRAKAAGKRGKK